MNHVIFVVPKNGFRVLDPISYEELPKDGARVLSNPYWIRMESQGAVTIKSDPNDKTHEDA